MMRKPPPTWDRKIRWVEATQDLVSGYSGGDVTIIKIDAKNDLIVFDL